MEIVLGIKVAGSEFRQVTIKQDFLTWKTPKEGDDVTVLINPQNPDHLMIIDNKQKIPAIFKISYYSSWKQYNTLGNFSFWPAYAIVILLVLSAIFTGGSSLTVFLMYFSAFIFLFCVFVTRFYANSVLIFSDDGLAITKKLGTTNYKWSDISDIAFLVPRHGLSYLEITLTIYTKDNKVDYIFIESLYFKTASCRTERIRSAIEQYFSPATPTIQKSNFDYILLDKKHGLPRIL